MSVFRACDIRGAFPDELTEAHATHLGEAIAIRQGPVDVLVGGDARLSTPILKKNLIEALRSGGCRVIDLGLVPTPAFYYARHHLGVKTGVMVTASHNPAGHNGFKIILGSLPVSQAEIDEIQALVEAGAKIDVGGGSVETFDILAAYLAFGAQIVPSCTGLKVVVDYGNGMAALAGPILWNRCGAEVSALFEDIDGRFPNRSPNPTSSKNLAALTAAVVDRQADIGVAYDGDGDRVVFVDERGRYLENDKIIALFAEEMLRDGPGMVVYDQKCSRLVPDVVGKAGGRAVMERSGHTFIKRTFLQQEAVYAGELSGHHFFRSLPQGDDGVLASLLMTGILLRAKKSLATLLETYPTYAVTPDIRLPVEKAEADGIIGHLIEGLAPRAVISTLDGVRAEFEDGWGLARKSVTEPLITLRFEGIDRPALARIMNRFEEAAPELAGRLPDVFGSR